jgi:hypothetical protein
MLPKGVKRRDIVHECFSSPLFHRNRPFNTLRPQTPCQTSRFVLELPCDFIVCKNLKLFLEFTSKIIENPYAKPVPKETPDHEVGCVRTSEPSTVLAVNHPPTLSHHPATQNNERMDSTNESNSADRTYALVPCAF